MSGDVKVVIGFVVAIIVVCRVYSDFAVKRYKKKKQKGEEK